MDFEKLSIFEIRDGILKKEFTANEVLRFFIEKCKKNESYNAVIEIYDDALINAEKIDKKIANGEKVGSLAGVPICIKDNILYKGKKMSCASVLMKDFVAPYSSTVVEKLLAEDAIIFARTNMDEFAMGGSCENSIYGPCHNALNFDFVSGGSSGGSAVSVALGLSPCAIGTDTGGSIRQPASFNGIVGVKPTYGTVSRYGIVAFASSLDQASPFAKTVEECEFLLKIIAGKDIHDLTTINNEMLFERKQKYTIGICKEVIEEYKSMKYYARFAHALEKLKQQFNVVEIEIPHITKALSCYYIIAPAEATSNLARFDGIKYTTRFGQSKGLEDVYVSSRSEGFGKEVKRRIMLGNFVLSSGYFDEYYNKAKAVQTLIKNEFHSAFNKCDCIITPTTVGTSFKIGEKTSDPLSMYLEDLFTVPANIAGIPAISIPYEKGEENLPLGIQIMTDEKQDKKMFEIAKQISVLLGGEKC